MTCRNQLTITADGAPVDVLHCTRERGHRDWHAYEEAGVRLIVWPTSDSTWGPIAQQAEDQAAARLASRFAA